MSAFVAKYLSPPKGAGAGNPLLLRDWQQDIANGLFDAPRPRSGLLALPRGNGKSSLAAAFGLYALYADREPSPQVVIVATSEEQAGITFKIACQMVADSQPLADRTHFYADRLVVPYNGGELTVLPAEESSLQGYDPSLAICDEIGYMPTAVWEAVVGASGKRERSLVLGIGTPGPNREESPMWSMVQRGRRNPDSSFFFREWSAPANADADDPDVWADFNPAYGDFLFADAMSAVRVSLRDLEFRRKRLGSWIEGAEQWISHELWAACKVPTDPRFLLGKPYVLAFDGSASGDSTALVSCDLDGHLQLRKLWENPGDDRWRVDHEEVDAEVRGHLATSECIGIYCDPWGWRSEIEQWAKDFGHDRVIEFPTNVRSRMAPASDRFYAAVAEQRLSHDGNADLARHVMNTVAKATPTGDVITKESKSSRRKIDAAVCAVMAYEWAMWHRSNQRRKPRVAVWR